MSLTKEEKRKVPVSTVQLNNENDIFEKKPNEFDTSIFNIKKIQEIFKDKTALSNALNGLFNIDDTKDADTDEYAKQTQGKTQDEAEEKIGAKEISVLQAVVKKYNKTSEEVANILIKYGYANFNEVKMKDFIKIGNEISGR